MLECVVVVIVVGVGATFTFVCYGLCVAIVCTLLTCPEVRQGAVHGVCARRGESSQWKWDGNGMVGGKRD